MGANRPLGPVLCLLEDTLTLSSAEETVRVNAEQMNFVLCIYSALACGVSTHSHKDVLYSVVCGCIRSVMSFSLHFLVKRVKQGTQELFVVLSLSRSSNQSLSKIPQLKIQTNFWQ